MIITIDVGNTNITIILYDDKGKNLHEFRLVTKKQRTADELGLTLKNFIIHSKIVSDDIKAIIIASVVPAINDTLTYACKKYLSIVPLFINSQEDHKLKIPLDIRIDIPAALGADRIAGSIGAIARHGESLIIFDFGTATVSNVIHNNIYLGGTISPGIDTSINALHKQVSLLPFYKFQKPKKIIATSTNDALYAGIFYGTIGMVEKIISEVKNEFKKDKFKIVATGGLSSFLKGHTKAIDVYDSDLTNFGLYKIYEYNFG